MLKFKSTFLLAAVLALSCSPLGDDTGTNTLIKESLNQRRNKKAILFLKQAGATVADSYQVTVADSQHALDTSNEVGNTFTFDDNHGATRLDTNSVSFTWLDDNTLEIDYDKKLRTFIQELSVDKVTIIYKPR